MKSLSKVFTCNALKCTQRRKNSLWSNEWRINFKNNKDIKKTKCVNIYSLDIDRPCNLCVVL